MTWKSRSAPVPPAERIRPEQKVYQDHIAILREMKAPEQLIKIAEKVAAENTKK